MLMLVLSIPCFAQQNKAEGEKSKSKAVEFMSQSGTLIRKDFYDIHKDKYGVISTAKRIAPFLKNEMRIFKEKRNVSRMQESFYNSLHFQ